MIKSVSEPKHLDNEFGAESTPKHKHEALMHLEEEKKPIEAE